MHKKAGGTMPAKPFLTRPIRYHYIAYGFEIAFPRWWNRYTSVGKTTTSGQETTISFLFRYRGHVYEPVVTILIVTLSEKEWRRQYEDSPFVFLGEQKGRSYAYVLPEELPETFLQPDKLDYDYKRYGRPIRLLKTMVAQAPAVMKSFVLVPPFGATPRC
jgi:hypothetical protein